MQKYEVCWSKGVGFRNSANIEDKTGRIAQNGDVVVGRVQGDWIIEAGTELYLPLRGPKRQLLARPAWDDGEDDGVGQAQSSNAPPPRVNELELLHAKGDSKFGRPRNASSRALPSEDSRTSRSGQDLGVLHALNNSHAKPSKYSAATAHERDEEYMREFERGLKEQGVDTSNDPYLHPEAHAKRPSEPIQKPLRLLKPMSQRTGESAIGNLTQKPSNAIVPNPQTWTSVKHGREVTNISSSGRVVDLSDRNLLCAAAHDNKVVFGCADHSLKEINASSGTVVRKLFTKTFGHTDWVCTVDYGAGGKILSGGTDGKLCLWNSSGPSGIYLKGHTSSISKVRCIENTACSASYDKTLRLWDIAKKKELATLMGHTASVMDFVWSNDCSWIGSGDRGGSCKMFDVSTATKIADLKGHKGHITALALASDDDILYTGAQDGHIRVWDKQQRINTNNLSLHTGAINEIGFVGDYLISVGADKRILCMDRRQNFNPVWEQTTKDFVYSMMVTNDAILLGDGIGSITCHDLTGAVKYELKTAQNAIRCLVETPNVLVCGGDDGNAILYDF